MPSFTDQTGRLITLQAIPSRIISLVPSQTELLFDLDLNDQVAGITKFCNHPPEWFYTKTRIGGTKKVNFATIQQLAPDLIIANKEENTREDVDALASHYPVWVSDVKNLADAYAMIGQIGLITGKHAKAEQIISGIEKEFTNYVMPHGNHTRAAYIIWNDPLMTVGGDTFCNAMLKLAGFENIFADRKRYPATTIDEIQDLDCNLLLLASEPYPFRQKHIDQLQSQVPGMKFLLVDGEMFSWFGSRLQYAPAYFFHLQKKLSLLL